MQKRQHVQYNFKDVYGNVWTKYQVDSYNSIQDRINRCIDEGRTVPDNLLNTSHKIYHEAQMFEELNPKFKTLEQIFIDDQETTNILG